MKIRVIIPYFGEWPEWMEYYLQGCASNPSIHWLLYTDCKKPDHLPDNVQYEHKSLGNFNVLASNKLKLNIAYHNPYKICDLRPAFGNIFSDYLADCDFWGYADLDVIFGNISTFTTNDRLENHDVFSVRKNYMAGHFALFRNTGEINSLYTRSENYRHIFEDSTHHFAFDERSNIVGRKLSNTQSMAGKSWIGQRITSLMEKIRFRISPTLRHTVYPDMTSILKKLSESGEIRWFHEDLVRSDFWFEKQNIWEWEITWENGRIQDALSREELLHFHIIRSKHKSTFKIEPWQTGAGFTIRPTGIAPIPKNN